jgi:2-polyprenyl-3-methyl-5-hydroxy-6-metoxy-1,4-benzoquinol methylase
LILKKIDKEKKLTNLKILDFGCGSGFTLNRISQLFPNNELFGFDYNNKYLKKIQRIKNFKRLFLNNIENINKKFDIIILNHVFEHLINPILYLKKISKILNHNGLVLLQMPNISRNFTDILTYDHICYYDEITLKNLLINSNLFKFSLKNIIKKEITCFLFKKKINQKLIKSFKVNNFNIENKILKLKNFAGKIKRINTKKNYIFGTTVPAIWASKIIGKKKFQNYIEEDQQKVNKLIHQKKVISLKMIKKDYNLIIPYPKILQNKILKKINNVIYKKNLYLL